MFQKAEKILQPQEFTEPTGSPRTEAQRPRGVLGEKAMKVEPRLDRTGPLGCEFSQGHMGSSPKILTGSIIKYIKCAVMYLDHGRNLVIFIFMLWGENDCIL